MWSKWALTHVGSTLRAGTPEVHLRCMTEPEIYRTTESQLAQPHYPRNRQRNPNKTHRTLPCFCSSTTSSSKRIHSTNPRLLQHGPCLDQAVPGSTVYKTVVSRPCLILEDFVLQAAFDSTLGKGMSRPYLDLQIPASAMHRPPKTDGSTGDSWNRKESHPILSSKLRVSGTGLY